jgi:hypothetical protein
MQCPSNAFHLVGVPDYCLPKPESTTAVRLKSPGMQEWIPARKGGLLEEALGPNNDSSDVKKM